MFIKSALLLFATALSINPLISIGEIEDNTPEAYKAENFLNPENYNFNENAPIKTEEGLKITSPVTYKIPFDFQVNTSKKIKFKFNVNEVENRGTVHVIFHSNPDDVIGGVSDEINGLYMRLSDVDHTSYNLDGYYTDGINFFHEMMAGTVNYKGDMRKDHTFQLETSMIQGYTDGIRMFYNGKHFGDWLGYSMIKNRVLTDSTGCIYITLSGNCTITNIVETDVTAPKITYTEPEYRCYAGDEYVFGNIDVLDAIDGRTPYEVKLLNSENKDISEKLYRNEDDKLCFKPLQTGTYTLRIASTDYSYNTSSRRIEFDALNKPNYPRFVGQVQFDKRARNNEKYYFPVPQVEDDSGNPGNITIDYSGYFYTDGNIKTNIVVKEDEKGYYFLPSEYDNVKTDGVGNYFLTITATNSYGTSYAEQDIWVKYPTTGKESTKKENIYNKYNWASNNLNSINGENVYLGGSTYYKAGLPLEDGIEVNFSILDLKNKATYDTWFSFALLKHPGIAKYSDNNVGLYLMFFYENGAFRYNAQYVFEDGTHLDIKNNEVLYAEIPSEFSFKIQPFDVSLDASMYDNVELFLDGQKCESFEVYKIERSNFMDDEGQVYLSYGYYNAHESGDSFDTTSNSKVRLNSIAYSDFTAPTIELLGECPSEGKVNEEILLPNAKAIDDVDGEVEATLLSVKNEKDRGVTVINNVFIPKENGVYKITYAATDSSGNSTTLVKEIKITGGKSTNKKGCGGSLISSSLLLSLISISGLTLLMAKRRKNDKD